MKVKFKEFQLAFLGILLFFGWMCVPPETEPMDTPDAEQARLDSLREVQCPRLMSSAAEYYRNRDWESTVRIYSQILDLGCDQYDPNLAPPQEIYLYYAIAYEFMGKFDSSEYVLIRGLQLLPDNVELRKRLAYAYRKQGKYDKEILEYERLIQLAPDDISLLTDLAKLYAEQDRYDDQIYVLKKILEIDPNNEIAQSDMALAYEKTGRDPLEVYRNRYESNPDNISYGLDYVDRLFAAERPEESIPVLRRIIRADASSKIAYRKLGEAYALINDLESASKAYEDLFKLDPRDFRVAIKISEVNTEIQNWEKALFWADKAIQISHKSGEAYAQKGNVYYQAFRVCRSAGISTDDRIVAKLAYKYFTMAEEKGYRRHSDARQWLSDNDVLFNNANWFMLDPEVKNRGWVKPKSECYSWVAEKLEKEPGWK
jgi:tetratricopeptide (TPR) repeat protein